MRGRTGSQGLFRSEISHFKLHCEISDLNNNRPKYKITSLQELSNTWQVSVYGGSN